MTVDCPCCRGRKYLNVIEHYYDGSVLTRMKCCHCDGHGKIEIKVVIEVKEIEEISEIWSETSEIKAIEEISEIQPKTGVSS